MTAQSCTLPFEGAAASPYTPPFSVQSSCVLSEDYFLTDQVIMNSSDMVRPFVRAGKPTAAVEVTDGAPEDWPQIGQYFTMAAAIASTILGSIYNFQTSDDPFTQAAGVVSNVSHVIAPFATKTLAETTDGSSSTTSATSVPRASWEQPCSRHEAARPGPSAAGGPGSGTSTAEGVHRCHPSRSAEC